MAKSTVNGGPSATDHEMSDGGPIVFQRAEIGFVDRPTTPENEEEEIQSQPNQGDGGDSSPSSKKEASRTEISTHYLPSPVPTTESHSKAPEKGHQGSTASTTVTGGQTKPARRSSRVARKPAENPRAPRVRSTDEEDFDDFD